MPAAPAGPAKLIGIGELLGLSWQEARVRYGQLIALSLVPAGAALLAAAVGFGLWFLTKSIGIVWIYGVLAFIAVVAFGFYAEAGGMLAAFSAPRSKTFSELLREGKKYALSLFGVGFIYGLGVGVGFVLLIIPGIWLAVRYSMALFIVVGEGVGTSEALKRSAAYTKGYFWAIFGRGFVLGLIYIVIGIVVNLVGTNVLRTLGVPDAEKYNLSSLVNVLLAPWYTMYGVSLYKSLKAVRGQVSVATV